MNYSRRSKSGGRRGRRGSVVIINDISWSNNRSFRGSGSSCGSSSGSSSNNTRRRRHGGHRRLVAATFGAVHLNSVVARILIMVVSTILVEQQQQQRRQVRAQPDYTCNYQADTCTQRNDGTCDNQASDRPIPACTNGDCIDCLPQCAQYSYDCDACLTQAAGCYYCPADGTCYNSNEYTWPGKVSGCAGPTNYLFGSNQSSLCSRYPDSAIFNDPLYDAQRWMLTMIDVETVWDTLGLTGEGIKVRINDDGVDVDSQNIDLVPNFDLDNSCPNGGHLPNPDDVQGHGTKVAGIVAAVANNSHCAMGVAPAATFSSCNIFRPDAAYSELAYGAADGAFDISQSSFGLDACGSPDAPGRNRNRDRRSSLRRKAQETVPCPFNPTLSDFQPCTVCESYFQNGTADDPTAECQKAIVDHCFSAFEDDYVACSDFFDIIIGGGCNYDKLPPAALEAITKGITEGRDGKGAIYVIASGNGYRSGDDVNFGGLTNSRFTISVGAVGKNGLHASYSTPGAAISVSAPAGDTEDISKIMTTAFGTGGCADSGQGTSFAAPVVSGVIALMLQANPDLTWRDVQNIIARTAIPVENDPDDDTAYRNAAGIWHSNYYGFGIINANTAVTMAMSDEYTLVQQPEATIIVESEENIDVVIQDAGGGVASTQLVVDESYSTFVVESVSVFLHLDHFSRGDLEIVLTSPSGTKSRLHPGKRPENQQNARWKLVTMRNWGESPNGVWTLEFTDLVRGDVADCADVAFFATLNGRPIDCDSAKADGYCSNGNVIVDPNDPINTDFLSLNDNGKTVVESCCECGGGLATDDVSDVLKDWKIQLFGQGGSTPATPEPAEPDVSVYDGTVDSNTSVPTPPSITTGQSCGAAVDIDQESGPLSGIFGQSIDVSQMRGGSCMGFDGAGIASFGQYYKVQGNGNIYTFTACLPNHASEPGVSIFTGQDCSRLSCLDQQVKQATLSKCPDKGSGSTVSWFSEEGVTYYILVSQLPTAGIAPESKRRNVQSTTEGPNSYTVSLTESLPSENLDCDAAIGYTGGLVVGNTLGGTESPNCDGRLDRGSWFIIEPGTFAVAGGASTIGFMADTCNIETSFNNSVSVYRGSCSSLECVSLDYLSCQNGMYGQSVFWTAETDEKYFLFVHPDKSIENDDFSAGSFALSVQAAVRPENDDCDGAVTVTVNGDIVVGSTKGVMPDTASHNFSPSCGLGGAGSWYNITGDGRTLQASTCHSGTRTATSVFVFTGSCQRLTCVAAEVGNVEACLAKGNGPETAGYAATVNFDTEIDTDYFILVASANGSVGEFELSVTAVNETPENNICSKATELVAGQTAETNTLSSTHDFPYGAYCGLPLQTAGNWFTVEGTGRGFSVSTCLDSNNRGYNSAISVFTGRCNDVSNLQCVTGTSTNDPSCDGGVTASFLSQVDTTYYIYVHGARPNSMGSTSISVEEFDVVEPNEFCTGAFEAATDGSRIQGSTEDAIAPATAATQCGVDIESPGLWYYFDSTPTLDVLDITACALGDDGTFDVSVSIFSSPIVAGSDIASRGCGFLQCVTGLTYHGERCLAASSSSRRQLQNSAVESAIILATEPNLRYHIFVHGNDPSSGGAGAGGFELYIRQRTSIISDSNVNVNANSTIPSDLPRGADLFRWTTIGTPITFELKEAGDQITSVSLLTQPSGGDANVNESNGTTTSLTYTPKPSFFGYDDLALSVCYETSATSSRSGRTDDCFVVKVTYHVLGTPEQAKSAQQTGSEKSNKWWLLMLLLLLPCVCCCIWYIFYRDGDDEDDEDDDHDGEDSKDEFDDEFHSENDELVPSSQREEADEDEESQENEEDDDSDGGSENFEGGDDTDDEIDVNEYSDDDRDGEIQDDTDNERTAGWESSSEDGTEDDQDLYFDTSGRLA